WCPLGDGRGQGRAVEAERVEELLRAFRAAEAVALVQPEPEIDAVAPAALGEDQVVEVAGGADGLHVFWPVGGVVDEQAGEHVVRWVLLQLEPELPADRGVAAVGTDDQASVGNVLLAVMGVAGGW